MFDRIALINLDKRRDRLGAFKAKVLNYPTLSSFTRVRAVHGDTVSVPQFFISGGGAWGCRQSHLRVLEDAMLDGIGTLCVFEDDVIFAENFESKLLEFFRICPDDWDGLMLGGQNMATPPKEIGIDGVLQTTNTQRTHAYVIRGLKPMQDLYRLWARCERHIDHVFGQWQKKWVVYQPDPFLCGQDATTSDISGRNDKVRFWNGKAADIAPKDHPITALLCDRNVMEQSRQYGFHCGHDRDPITGLDRGLTKIAIENWPAAKLATWGNTIVNEACEADDVPGIWHSQTPDAKFLEARLGRPVTLVEGRTIEEIVLKIPALKYHYDASKIVWCIRTDNLELLEGMRHFGWHRGQWLDEVTGLDQGLRQMVQSSNWGNLRNLVRQLRKEIMTIRHGKILLAHPQLDIAQIREVFKNDCRVEELTGPELKDCLNQLGTTVNGDVG